MGGTVVFAFLFFLVIFHSSYNYETDQWKNWNWKLKPSANYSTEPTVCLGRVGKGG